MALKKSDIRAIISNEDASKDEKISSLLDLMHTELDAIKDERDEIKAQIDALKKDNENLKNSNDDNSNEWQKKYEAEKKAFAEYKQEISNKELKAGLEGAYTKMLKNEGVSEKAIELILKSTDLSNEKLTDGEFENKEAMVKTIKEKYSDFITTKSTEGAKTPIPPKNDGGEVSREQFAKMGYKERVALYNENKELYNNLSKGE